MKYKIILWDFDGTLAYTGRDVWNSLEYAAAKCGGKFPLEFTENDSNLGKPMTEIFHQILPALEEEKLIRFEELVRVHYRTQNEYKDTYLYPGIYELLLDMRKSGITQYIITMKAQEALARILLKKNWTELFDGFVSPDSFPGNERTKSEMIAFVMKNLTFKKSKYVYIGDTWSDVSAAYENGIDCIGVTYGDGETNQLLASNPVYCVQEVSDIQKILRKGV